LPHSSHTTQEPKLRRGGNSPFSPPELGGAVLGDRGVERAADDHQALLLGST